MAALGAAALMALAGCGSVTPTATTPAVAAEPAVTALDATSASEALAVAGLVAEVLPTGGADDPNQLLGRADGYTSRASFTVPGYARPTPVPFPAGLPTPIPLPGSEPSPHDCDRGGCVEGWPSAAAATSRADYIVRASQAVPGLRAGYVYARPDGLLLRITADVLPEQAEAISAAFLAL